MGTVSTRLHTKPQRKTLGIRATPEQSRVLAEAAKREHRSVNSFVLQAALNAAEAGAADKARRSPEEIMAIVKAARAKVHLPPGRDILEEFLAERRAEAARE